MNSQSQQAGSEQTAEQRRRKRRERAAKSRTPDPKNIVSGAGQPLDPGVRRELEEQLGHDLSRVRLHTGRDAGQLTELLGADAVAVGQDVFFAEGTFKPGTDEGRRLLAHELLHTVQNPHGLGALRAGRELGAVSLPQQAIEREAEAAAQDLVRPQPGESAPKVEEGQATPGWLRYATVDADRRRMEQLDPATIVDRLANGVLRSLRGDPEDRSGRVRLQLARMAPQVQDSVLDRLELRLPTPVLDRLLEAVEETEQGPLPLQATGAPGAVAGETEELEQERERDAAEQRDADDRPAGGTRDDRRDDEGKPAQGGARTTPEGRGAAAADPAAPEQSAAQDKADSGTRQEDASQARQEDRDASGSAATQDESSARAEQESPQEEQEEEEEGEAQEETAPQVEQHAAEQSPSQTDAPAAEPAAPPSGVDRSGMEPGEKTRTGAEVGAARSVGDPENSEDSDDEPLGLDSEAEDQDTGPDAETDEDVGSGQETVPDVELVGDTPAAKNPGLVEERKKNRARPLSLASPAADTPVAEEPVQDEPQADGSRDDASEDAESQDLFSPLSTEQDQSAEGGDGSPASATAAGAESATGSAGKDWDKQRTDERNEDGDARRRDEQARAADGAAGAAVSEPAETAAPGQLDKAGEDARRQEAGTSSSSSSSSQSAGTPEGGGTASARAETSADTARSADQGTEQQSGGAEKSTPAGSGGTDQATAAPEPTTVPGEQDVTEGRGPATSAGPETGPDKVSASGPDSAPSLAPGNGPAPASVGPQPKTNAPKAVESPSAASTGSAARPKPTGAKRQAARQVAKTARRGGGGRSGAASAPVRGGGGGGGSRATVSGSAKGKKEAAAPDVSNATPEGGLATAAGLKPYQMVETLEGVDGAVGRSVGKERSALRKAPPTTRRPSGSPRTVPGGPKPAAAGTYTNAKVARTDAAQGKTPEITGDQKPEGEVPGANMPEPSWWDIAVTIGAKLLGSLLKEILPLDDLIDSILQIPTKDEGMRNAKVGDAPGLPLENDSDPQRTDEQGGKLDERKTELHQAGRDDAARPMGEDQLYPDVPKETLTGKVPGGSKATKGGAARSVSGGVPIESASAIAEHDRGPQIQAGFADGRQKMGQERQAKDKKAGEDQKQYDTDLQREVSASGKKQADARDKGRSDISDSRDKWRKEQDDKVTEIDDKKGKKHDQIRKDIKKKEEDTDKDVDKRTEDDNQKIDDEQTNAEQEAEKKQDDGKDDADNWLEEAIDKLKEFFEELKNAIKTVFEKARQAVTDLIDQFKQAVFKLIDDARNWVIDQINTFADALIALGDELLADYPAMRDKWRNTIDGARDWAVEKVNEFADALKEVAGKLLDGLCGALLAGLDMLETGLLAAVDVVESVTVGALEFGASVVAGLGEWAAIFNDIVSDPGDWISKAGAAAETGAKEHLFNEIKTAVRAWFNQKVQEIIGIPLEDFQALLDGGVSVDEMAKMAWDEALPQLPVIIGVMVVEKVVAKLIPGAGWVMAVIDALQTAWGALSEILAAFGLFMDFLKSVKSGSGARPFAKAVAAGVVALLELVYQFLVEGISRYLGKVAEKLGNMLKNIIGKRKKPGGADAPGAPDSPNRPKDDRPKDDDAKDDDSRSDRPKDDDPAGKDRPDDSPAPRKPSPDKTSRPQSRPRPGKRSSPEKKPRPSHTTRSKKRRDDDERREEGRDVNAARRRARDAERRTRDDKADRTDTPTRRGPAKDTLRPDRRRSDDRDPKNTRPDDRRRDTDKDGKDGRREPGKDRKKDTDKDSKRRPSDRARRRVRRARQTIKSAVNRARRAVGKLFGKARRKVGGNLNDRLRRLRDQWRGRHDRDRDKDRRPDRDKQREQEGRSDYDLPSVHFRTVDGGLHTLLFDSKGKSADLAMRSTLAAITGYIDEWGRENNSSPIADQRELHTDQETARKRADTQRAIVEAAQNRLPDREVTRGRRTHGEPIFLRNGRSGFDAELSDLQRLMERLAELLELRSRGAGKPPLPDTILPPFSDGTVARSFKASYIQQKTPNGSEAGERPEAWPLGWDRIVKGNHAAGAAWVRMHMLTAQLGGHASTSNLVPATKADNDGARDGAEHPAARAIGKRSSAGTPEDMAWYDVNIVMRNEYPGFPRTVTMRWGTYHYPSGHWERKSSPGGYWRGQFDPPPWTGGVASPPVSVNLNQGNHHQIRATLKISTRWAKVILGARNHVPGSRFSDMADLENELLKSARGNGRASRERLVVLLKRAESRGKIFF